MGQEPTKGLAEHSFPYSTPGIVTHPDAFPIPNYPTLHFFVKFRSRHHTSDPTICPPVRLEDNEACTRSTESNPTPNGLKTQFHGGILPLKNRTAAAAQESRKQVKQPVTSFSATKPRNLVPKIHPSKSGYPGGKYDLVDSNFATSCCKQEFASPEDTDSRDHFCCDSTRFPKNSADSRRRDSDNIAPSRARYNNDPSFYQKLAEQQRSLSLKSKPT